MLNTKTIEKSLAAHLQTDDASLAESLHIFGGLLKNAARISSSQPGNEPEWTTHQLAQALKSKETILAQTPVAIDSAAFEAALKDMAACFLDAAGLAGDLKARCEAVVWSDYAVPALTAVAGRAPLEYMQAVESLAQDDDLLDLFIFPVIGFTLRAFLDATATAASTALDKVYPDTVHIERPLNCPVCGSPAAIAAVVETMHNGNVKRLYCNCCGGWWKFERIRCAVCGDEAVSDLEYVHDASDDKRRLHVCKSCHRAMPTLFVGESVGFSPDVESIAMSGLENYYDETHPKA